MRPLSILVGLFVLAGCGSCSGGSGSRAADPSPVTTGDRGAGGVRAAGPGGSTRSARASRSGSLLRIEALPDGIRVLQPTTVRLRVVWTALQGDGTERTRALPEGATVRWDLAGTVVEGNDVVHTFPGASSDVVVKVEVWLPAVKDRSSRALRTVQVLPLERLSVTGSSSGVMPALPPAVPPGRIPRPPDPGPSTFRFVVVSDSNSSYGSVLQAPAASAAIDRIRFELGTLDFVVHNGDMIAGQKKSLSPLRVMEMWAGYEAGVRLPLAERGIPVLPSPGNHDAAQGLFDRTAYGLFWNDPVRKPVLRYTDDAHYPLRYAFEHKGSLFVIIDGATGRMGREQLDWIRRVFEGSERYDNRFVFTHVPLYKITARNWGTLGRAWELYRLFVEHRVTVLFSGHYEVYYRGFLGVLPIVSTGHLGTSCRNVTPLQGCQGNSFVVVDVAGGRLSRVFAVPGPRFGTVFDESTLPVEAEVYHR